MKTRLIVRGFLLSSAITAVLWSAGAGHARAQEGCGPNQVCNPVPCPSIDSLLALEFDDSGCTTQAAVFTPTMDTWTYIFGGNNAIKISTDVTPVSPECPLGSFELFVDRMRISQVEYAARRDNSQFADTVCNPTFEDGECNFFRVHGETVPRGCYGPRVDYMVFWNTPPIQGNKH